MIYYDFFHARFSQNAKKRKIVFLPEGKRKQTRSLIIGSRADALVQNTYRGKVI